MTGLNMKKRMAVALMIIALLFSFHGVLAEGSPPSTGETESVSYKMDESLKNEDEQPATIRETKLEPYMVPGNIITFGTYPQTKEGTDQTPIEWIVLDYDEANHKTLLISRYCLDTMKYDTSFSSVTWEKCTLRSWLNDEFLNKAFSEKEQSAILTTEVDNSENQSFGELGLLWGNDTQDKIFLLSVADARFYFGARWWEEDDGENTASRAAPTAYAIKQGAGVIDGCLTADGEPAWWWWLRSSGLSRNNAARVNYDGSLHDDSDADPAYGTVRPVLWLEMNADIF